MRLLPYGREAILIDLLAPPEVEAWRGAVARVPGVSETVPGACSVLARVAAADLTAVWARLEGLSVASQTEPHPERSVVEIAVSYDGPDLEWVASTTRLSTDEVIALHTVGEYHVRFLGFAPGFAYLDGLDPRLRVARLAEPRAHVPAGSVAIAGEFAAVYPRSSPGGWRILGTTQRTLWDLDADPPALLPPGTRVRFVAS